MSGHASGEAVIGVTLGMTILAAVAVTSRLATRLGIVHNAGYDDIFIAVALLFSIATTVTMIFQVKYGMGKHQDTLSEHNAIATLRPFWASIWVYNVATTFTKLSILFQYLRIFPHEKFRMACFILIGVVFIYGCWAFLSAVFMCWPVAYFWDSSIKGHCLDRFALWFANASVNIVTEVTTVALPLPIVKSLNLPDRQRHILMLIFALGGFTCVISVIRLQSLYVISQATDVSWNNPLAAIWSSVEINTGILWSCLPTLKGCVTRFFPRLFSTTRSRSTTWQHGQPNNNLASSNRNALGFGAFSQGLTGHENPVQKTIIHSRVDRTSSDDIDLRTLCSPPKGHETDDTHIQVVTVVEQEFERVGHAQSETGSTSDLVMHG